MFLVMVGEAQQVWLLLRTVATVAFAIDKPGKWLRNRPA